MTFFFLKYQRSNICNTFLWFFFLFVYFQSVRIQGGSNHVFVEEVEWWTLNFLLLSGHSLSRHWVNQSTYWKGKWVPRKKWHQIAHSLAGRVRTNYRVEIQKKTKNNPVKQTRIPISAPSILLICNWQDLTSIPVEKITSTCALHLPWEYQGKMALRSLCLKVQSDEVDSFKGLMGKKSAVAPLALGCCMAWNSLNSPIVLIEQSWTSLQLGNAVPWNSFQTEFFVT